MGRPTPPITPVDIRRAVGGDVEAMRALVSVLRPVVQAEVAWTLHRYRPRTRRFDVAQEVADLVQEVFVSLLENDGRTLLAWDPTRGRNLISFVKLVARHQVASILRSGRRCPWTEEPTQVEDLELAPTPSHENRVSSRLTANVVMGRLREALNPRGMMLFESLFVEERDVDDVCREFGMTRDAIYAWRTRTRRQLRQITSRLAVE